MITKNTLDSSTVSFSDVLGNGKLYHVPLFQRDYSWEIDQWEDLWSDINNLGEDKVHYMGAIVLQDRGEKNYRIIDGQQRFTTLSLIVLGVIRKLQDLIEEDVDSKGNEERVQLIKNKFIGDKDPASLTYSSKLQLNENNNSFFQSYLLIFREPVNVKTLIPSEKRLWQAYHFFRQKIADRFSEETNGEKITNFLNKTIAEGFRFIQILVEDELSAYTVFETLNSRGVGLTVTDLMKNYLFSLSSEVDLRHIKIQWNKIIEQIGLDHFPVFLRHFWISRFPLIRQEYLFKAIQSQISDTESVFTLLDNLERKAQLYIALSQPSDSFWVGKRERKKKIRELSLFSAKQSIPLLLIAYEKLPGSDFDKVLRIVSAISFRYSVICRLPSNKMEGVYNKASMKIASGELKDVKKIASELREIYPSDLEFKGVWETLSINTKKERRLVRYILFEIENHLSHEDRNFEDDPATIEHILPENSDENWDHDFPERIGKEYTYRLGNYTLLEADKNRDCGTICFEQKKAIFQTSQYQMTRDIQSNQWTPSSVESRQTRLAKQAISIWRVPYFDA